ncbi:extensin family protein [Phytoactinopolyspora halotolerans]|uniref:Extensin family protein n=1 Tax=Phytoactinopolyspora halotolerans TaxID=1981512 RepID=A0A6L9S5D3_9ACTN|nr:extensin family protein [Phytoactinopolyspora halotolerans]NED99701.1 extensin family protein [Phytoactinopolyspora halotolerans]
MSREDAMHGDGLDRRSLLRAGGLTVAAGFLAPISHALPAHAADDGEPELGTMAVCAGNPYVSRAWVGESGWDLRHRTGWNGQLGVHGGRHSEQFNATFHDRCNTWLQNLDAIARISRPSTSTSWGIQWLGDIGAGVCKTGQHGTGRALDISRVQWDGGYVDLNKHWRGPETRVVKRRYLAVVASCRRYFRNVFTAWYDTDGSHVNHVHVDDGGNNSGGTNIRTGHKGDTTIVQAAARYLGVNSDIVLDGIWGPITQSAYNTLMSRFKMTTGSGGCQTYNPLSSTADMKVFLRYVIRNAIADQNAGYYHAPTTDC